MKIHEINGYPWLKNVKHRWFMFGLNKMVLDYSDLLSGLIICFQRSLDIFLFPRWWASRSKPGKQGVSRTLPNCWRVGRRGSYAPAAHDPHAEDLVWGAQLRRRVAMGRKGKTWENLLKTAVFFFFFYQDIFEMGTWYFHKPIAKTRLMNSNVGL